MQAHSTVYITDYRYCTTFCSKYQGFFGKKAANLKENYRAMRTNEKIALNRLINCRAIDASGKNGWPNGKP